MLWISAKTTEVREYCWIIKKKAFFGQISEDMLTAESSFSKKS